MDAQQIINEIEKENKTTHTPSDFKALFYSDLYKLDQANLNLSGVVGK